MLTHSIPGVSGGCLRSVGSPPLYPIREVTPRDTTMLEPITLNTTMLIAASSYGIVMAVVSPGQYAPEIGSVFLGIFGGAMVQLWSVDVRKPTRKVMIADTMASALSGFAVPCLGVPLIIHIINRFFGLEITFELKDSLGVTLIVAGVAGMFGAGLIRKYLDKFNPGWMGKNGHD